MAKDDLDYCRRRISEETRLALAAPSPEAAEKHYQLAALYRGQLAVLTRGAQAVPEQVSPFATAT
jgi:hypothetical protein